MRIRRFQNEERTFKEDRIAEIATFCVDVSRDIKRGNVILMVTVQVVNAPVAADVRRRTRGKSRPEFRLLTSAAT